MQYRREIDGLRALAVLPVIFFHAGLASGGFVGVDIFFVISGYLITGIIASELDAGHFSLVKFYVRRVRRILPALFLVLTACLPFAWLWLLPEDLDSFAQSLLAVALFSSNFLFWGQTGYFDTASELKPLLHTWSLAVEEQYYVFFPLLMMLGWKLGRRNLSILLFILALASLGISEWSTRAQSAAAFYLLPWRAWELLAGAILGLLLSHQGEHQINRWSAEIGSMLGFSLVVYSVLFIDRSVPFPGFQALVPVIGASLIIWFAGTSTLVGKILGSDTLVGIGLISYSAYLWHQPLFALARHRSLEQPSEEFMTLLALATLGLAYCSWKFVERPFRTSLKAETSTVLRTAAAGSTLFIFLGILGTARQGFPERLPPYLLDPAKNSTATIHNGWCHYIPDFLGDMEVGPRGTNCWLGNPSAPVKGLLFGDSFAGHFNPLWDLVGKDAQISINAISTGGCYPSEGKDFSIEKNGNYYKQCLLNRQFVKTHLRNYDFVVLAGSWGLVSYNGHLPDFFRYLEKLTPQVPLVVIMASPKQFNFKIGPAYLRARWLGGNLNIASASSKPDDFFPPAERMILEEIKKYPNVIFVDRNSLFLAHGKPSDLTEEDFPFNWEGKHLSIYGSNAAARVFMASPAYAEFRQRLAVAVASGQSPGRIEAKAKQQSAGFIAPAAASASQRPAPP